mmetsp:Transcript_16553/g.33864  ORF Transcript_16553/g.33864 Transcript_16553/m.33864 type:complete len:250 (-) Transcript_16553:164-913(-)
MEGKTAGFVWSPAIGSGKKGLLSGVCRSRHGSGPVGAQRWAMQHTLDGVKVNGEVEAVRNYIFVRIADVPDTTESGLFIARKDEERPNYGYVVSVGSGSFFPTGGKIPMRIKENDVVLYGKYGGQNVDYDGVKHCFISQDDVLCTFRDGTYAAENVLPTSDYVCVKKDKKAEQTSSGILLAGTAGEQPTTGTVTAVGPGRLMENGEIEPLLVQPGDKVLFGKYGGSEMKFGEDQYLMTRVSEIYAYWKE